METKDIILHLKSLAKDPESSTAIVHDQGCLPGLVLFLEDSDSEITQLALETLELLAENARNHQTMWKEVALVVSLNGILDNEHSRLRHRELANSILEAITPRQRTITVSSARKPLGEVQNTAFFKANLNKEARTFTLQINYVSEDAKMEPSELRRIVEDELLYIKGVISFTFNMATNRVTVRTRKEVDIETLCHAVEGTKLLTAQQVVRNDQGNEVFLSFGRSPKCAKVKAELDGGYLDDELDQPVSDKAIASTNGANGGGWFSTVGGYLARTLYW